MALSKYRLNAFGLCAVVLGLMVFGTGSAQAEVGSKWDVAGTPISAGLLPFVQVKEIEELKEAPVGRHLVLLTKVLGSSFHILCAKAELKEFHLLVEGGSLGKIKFSECVILINGTVSKACEPHNGAELGVIETVLLKDLIVLHELAGGTKDVLDRLEPNAGTNFVVIETSEACAVGAKIPIGGKFFIKDCQNAFSTSQPTHLIEQGPLTHLYTISDTAEHASNIDGSAVLELSGIHKGMNWNGLAI